MNMRLGRFGYYYPYTNDKGETKNLSFKENFVKNYYQPGYLTDDLIDEMVSGKEIKFKTDTEEISAKINSYYNETYKKYCTSVEFYNSEGNKINPFTMSADSGPVENPDYAIIRRNLETITLSSVASEGSYYRYSFTKPQYTLDKLDLKGSWKTWTTEELKNGIRFVSVTIHRPRAKKDPKFIGYWYKDKDNNPVYVSSEDIERVSARLKIERDTADAAERDRKEAILKKYRDEYDAIKPEFDKHNKWVNDLRKFILDGNTINMANLESTVKDVSVDNLDDRVISLLNSTPGSRSISWEMNRDFTNAESIEHNSYSNEAGCMYKVLYNDFDEKKKKLLEKLKVAYEYAKNHDFRVNLINRINSEGLDSVVSDVNIDLALDLGRFQTVKKVLLKQGSNAPKYVCYNMYLEELNLAELETKLLNLLKVYHDFYDMPEKDRKAIAKFVAVHKLKDYYDQIKSFDDVTEIIIDNSTDPKFLKEILTGIAGTPKANILKDKTYYFELRNRLRSDILLYKPIDLIDKLRALIPAYNVASNVAVLTNIELDADESFVFQFYTFAKSEGDESGFDGRRLSNITRMYNRGKDKKDRIYFYTEDDNSEEDDE